MRLPDFFLVGAPKAGTTSIYEYLGQHPDIFNPSIKEPHFFAYPEVMDTYYEVPFIDNIDDYAAIYDGASELQKAGDFSPSYLYRQKAPHRIKRYCPEARILIVLRDPVERAISHYLMDVRDGYQTLPLSEWLQRADETSLFYREYVEVGLYAEQVQHYKNVFRNDQLKIWLFEDLSKNTSDTIKEMMYFIGVDESISVNLSGEHNKYQVFRSRWLREVVQTEWAQQFVRMIPQRLKEHAKRLLVTDSKPEFNAAQRRLKQIFEDDVHTLQKTINRDLSHWLQ